MIPISALIPISDRRQDGIGFQMTDLTELEQAVLTKLLMGDHPLLRQLRDQLDGCRVSLRELTGVGFYTYLDVGDMPVLKDINVRFGDVAAEIQGMAHGAGFVLYVKHGKLSLLEGYTFDDPWPTTITGYSLQYFPGGQRDDVALSKALESGDIPNGGCNA
jgi:hypothetical protein